MKVVDRSFYPFHDVIIKSEKTAKRAILKEDIVVLTKLSLNENILGLNHQQWCGCFGVQSFINYNFLKYIEKKYNLFELLYVIKNRQDRCALERIFGAIFFTEDSYRLPKIKSILGNVFSYQKWGYTFDEYENDISKNKISKPILKVFTGR
jgi:hypothetical protein